MAYGCVFGGFSWLVVDVGRYRWHCSLNCAGQETAKGQQSSEQLASAYPSLSALSADVM